MSTYVVGSRVHEIPDETQAQADEAYMWFVAYQRAGFTPAQAMAFMTRAYVNVGTAPETSEAMSKISLVFDKIIAEDA